MICEKIMKKNLKKLLSDNLETQEKLKKLELLTPNPLTIVVKYHKDSEEEHIKKINQIIKENPGYKEAEFYCLGSKFMENSERRPPLILYPLNLFREKHKKKPHKNYET